MANTTQLDLPLVEASQAQKHVTVNEALSRLDGMVQLRLIDRTLTNPPATADDGETYEVPGGAVNAWAGQAGNLAIASNGGWLFVAPKSGWRAWDVAAASELVFDGATWQAGALATSVNGTATVWKVEEFDHTITAGTTNASSFLVPSHSMVFAVTARVTQTITGTLTSWQLGMDGSADRFGSGLGLGQGSFARGVLGSPLTSYSSLPIDLTATGGDFAGGTVRIAVHMAQFELPAL
ncbi:hypothetical protein ACMU_06495 [Actibacterium mucosum KCTC 23349]|uniref:Uncharacterized protein n=1 Tax=Actibacterium mucosum KCTC 23349 TaxID=1454373 RepID=A0A037ZKF5_9RHOB|nr:DUF2793 domain-containing protein [Actibacterium mucosum]KAJ56588.1 hypothetical protein ACMU_06495 [Actibacterium mucosum KCTC 23349]